MKKKRPNAPQALAPRKKNAVEKPEEFTIQPATLLLRAAPKPQLALDMPWARL